MNGSALERVVYLSIRKGAATSMNWILKQQGFSTYPYSLKKLTESGLPGVHRPPKNSDSTLEDQISYTSMEKKAAEMDVL